MVEGRRRVKDIGKGCEMLGRRPIFFSGELPGGSDSRYVVCIYEHTVSNPKGRRLHGILIRILLHTGLYALHSVAKELVSLAKCSMAKCLARSREERG